MAIETQPTEFDGQTVSMRRAAQSLYDMTQFGTAPTENDSPVVSLRKVAGMLAAVSEESVVVPPSMNIPLVASFF
jgi:hypothetical protein